MSLIWLIFTIICPAFKKLKAVCPFCFFLVQQEPAEYEARCGRFLYSVWSLVSMFTPLSGGRAYTAEEKLWKRFWQEYATGTLVWNFLRILVRLYERFVAKDVGVRASSIELRLCFFARAQVGPHFASEPRVAAAYVQTRQLVSTDRGLRPCPQAFWDKQTCFLRVSSKRGRKRDSLATQRCYGFMESVAWMSQA